MVITMVTFFDNMLQIQDTKVEQCYEEVCVLAVVACWMFDICCKSPLCLTQGDTNSNSKLVRQPAVNTI